MKMSSHKLTTVISFISGKGGVGKTALAAATGKLLALLGHKVLLIDSDLVTHGLTFLLGFRGRKPGILEFYSANVEAIKKQGPKEIRSLAQAMSEVVICAHDNNLHFIQSASRPSLKYAKIVSEQPNLLNNLLGLLIQEIANSGKYEFVLVDAQAGPVSAVFPVVSASQKTVIVMEPDPVTVYATQNAVDELKDYLPKESFYLINKLSVGEASGYHAIEQFLKILNHLPPIPFDFQVRKSFMFRRIPLDDEKPTAFMFGIMQMLADLVPELGPEISRMEKRCREIVLGPTMKGIREAEKEAEELAAQRVRLEKMINEAASGQMKYSAIRNLLLPVMAAISFVFISLNIVFDVDLQTTLIGLSLSIFYVFLLWFGLGRKKSPLERDRHTLEVNLAMLEEKMYSIRARAESYRNLMVSTTSELMLGRDEDKQ